MPVTRRFRTGAQHVLLVTLSALCLAAPGRETAGQTPSVSYTILSSAGKRTLIVKPADPSDLVAVDRLVPIFGVTLKEDTLAGGLTITAGKQTIVLTPGQPLASISGRIVSLSAPVVKDGTTWLAPMDLLSRVIGPALGTRVDVRRESKLILIGDIRVPQVVVRADRQSGSGRILVEISPAAPYALTREATRMTARFTADGLDLLPVTGLPADLSTGVRADGTTLVIDLGSAAPAARATEDATGHTLVIDFAATPAASAAARPPQDAAALLAPASTGLRTIVIDAGHGGTDTGARGADDIVEKNLTIAVARKLKALIEERLGLRVIFTRDNDDEVDVDKRAAIANNNKADLLVSLHVNASFRPEARGAGIYVIDASDYTDRVPAAMAGGQLPLAGGGARSIEITPWGYGQLPHAAQSVSLAAVVERNLRAHGVAMHEPAETQAPLRLLAAVNMPAILLEMGFLSNGDDAQLLATDAAQTAIAEALLSAITEVRAGVPTTSGGGL